MQPILNLENVTRRYGRKLAVDSANFHLHQGKAACLLGPSGCGKSTVLRMIAGLEALDDGTIHIAQNLVSSPKQSIAPERRGVGLVFQDNALFPHLNVTDNIGFGLKNSSKAQKSAQISRLLDQFHISHLAKSWPHMLSGGEQQRVAIARALAREPALLLLDEPFSGLDGFLKESVREAVLRDLRQAGASFLIVTHDPDEALAIADDLILMAHGKILQTGSPEHCYHHPSSITAARLLGEMLLFPGEISGGELSCAWGKFDAAGFAGGKAQFGLRPEALSPCENGVSVHVQSIKFAGGNYRLSLNLGGTSFTIRLPQLPENIGSTLSLGFDRRNSHVFLPEI